MPRIARNRYIQARGLGTFIRRGEHARRRHLLRELLMDRITTRDELFAALDELVQAIDNPEVFTDEMSVQIFWERGRAHWEA